MKIMVEVVLIIAAMIGFTIGLYLIEIFYNWLNKNKQLWEWIYQG